MLHRIKRLIIKRKSRLIQKAKMKLIYAFLKNPNAIPEDIKSFFIKIGEIDEILGIN